MIQTKTNEQVERDAINIMWRAAETLSPSNPNDDTIYLDASHDLTTMSVHLWAAINNAPHAPQKVSPWAIKKGGNK